MKIYFMRHCNTVAFETSRVLSPEDELSATGKTQSEKASNYFIDKNLDLIITGEDIAAYQTAEIINNTANFDLEIVKSPLFKEITRPSDLKDKYTYDTDVLKFHELSFKNQHNENWTYSDDESFHDIKTRAHNAIDFLYKSKKENILVVSHITILVHIICHLIFGDKYNTYVFVKIKSSLRLEYSGIIEMELWQNIWMLTRLVNL